MQQIVCESRCERALCAHLYTCIQTGIYNEQWQQGTRSSKLLVRTNDVVHIGPTRTTSLAVNCVNKIYFPTSIYLLRFIINRWIVFQRKFHFLSNKTSVGISSASYVILVRNTKHYISLCALIQFNYINADSVH